MTKQRYLTPNAAGSTKSAHSTRFSDQYRFNVEALYGYFNVVNRHWCEVSRTGNLQRGIGLFGGFICLIAGIFFGGALGLLIFTISLFTGLLSVIMFFVLCSLFFVLCSLFFVLCSLFFVL